MASYLRSSNSVCNMALKLSAAALSKASPTEPMEPSMPKSCKRRLNTKGADMFCRICSYRSRARKNSVPIFGAIKAPSDGNPFVPEL